jgi:hypothetical protein
MRLTTLLLGFALYLFSFSAVSHGGGHSNTPVNQEAATINATKIVAALVERSKLEKIWASIKASSVEKITPRGNPEWLVIFVNEKITDTDKQKLYVFLTLGGDYIAANFTGK